MKHKWHKEIKAWADGAEIERWYWQYDGWGEAINPTWNERYEYRIKPKPVEPQYLYVYVDELWNAKLKGRDELFKGEFGNYIGKIKLEKDDD